VSSVPYQEAVNAWADSLLPGGLTRTGDADLHTTADEGYAYSTWTWEPSSFAVTLEVPVEGNGLIRWGKHWGISEDFGFAELLAEILAAANGDQ
jgi:hypothetical protein